MRKKKTNDNTCNENIDEDCSEYSIEEPSDELESGSDLLPSDIDNSEDEEENLDERAKKWHKANIAKIYRLNTMASTILKNFRTINELCWYLSIQIMLLNPEFIRKINRGTTANIKKVKSTSITKKIYYTAIMMIASEYTDMPYEAFLYSSFTTEQAPYQL